MGSRGYARVDELLEFIDRQYSLRDVSNISPIGRCDRVEIFQRLDVFTACERQRASLSSEQLDVVIVQVRLLADRGKGAGGFGVECRRIAKVVSLQRELGLDPRRERVGRLVRPR